MYIRRAKQEAGIKDHFRRCGDFKVEYPVGGDAPFTIGFGQRCHCAVKMPHRCGAGSGLKFSEEEAHEGDKGGLAAKVTSSDKHLPVARSAPSLSPPGNVPLSSAELPLPTQNSSAPPVQVLQTFPSRRGTTIAMRPKCIPSVSRVGQENRIEGMSRNRGYSPRQDP